MECIQALLILCSFILTRALISSLRYGPADDLYLLDYKKVLTLVTQQINYRYAKLDECFTGFLYPPNLSLNLRTRAGINPNLRLDSP